MAKDIEARYYWSEEQLQALYDEWTASELRCGRVHIEAMAARDSADDARSKLHKALEEAGRKLSEFKVTG